VAHLDRGRDDLRFIRHRLQRLQAREFMQIDVVVLSILIYALLGKLADSASRVLERLTLSWHPAFQKH
jgi:sulfonate transport system permease protein